MSFGPVMRIHVGDLYIELAPLTKESMGDFIDPIKSEHGINRHSVSQYVRYTLSRTSEQEEAYYEKISNDPTCVKWGIWVLNGSERELIGLSDLNSIEGTLVRQATSGSLIFRKEYWGKGIASAAHKARTWYAFTQLGLHRIMSAVIQGNEGSLKALTRSGYNLVYVERNTHFVNGRQHHQDNLECLNPLEPFWSTWWGTDKPSQRALKARPLVETALAWAEENVELL